MKNDPLKKATAANKVANAIDETIEQANRKETPRGHLGMSSIGGDKRSVWLEYRWSFPKDLSGRTLRIFELGNVIEDVVLNYLEDVGVEMYGRRLSAQIHYNDHDGHFAGSLDGAGRGVPGAPKTWHVIEIKTANDSRFTALTKDGYKKWSPTYYAQLQLYMHYSSMKRALVVVYNKNTSALYTERLEYKKLEALGFVQKALEILDDETLPDSSFSDRTWYEIANYKSDEYQSIYWGDELPRPNCRNCRFHARGDEASHGCMFHNKELSTDEQYAGCDDHNWLQELLSQQDGVDMSGMHDHHTNWIANGIEFANSADDGLLCFTSDEIRHMYKSQFEALKDKDLLAARKEFGARITDTEKMK